MRPKSMVGVHAVRIGIYRSRMVQGKKRTKNILDILAPWPLKEQGGKMAYGADLDDGFADDVTIYPGTYQFIRAGVYRFDLPKGVTGRGVARYGDSGTVTVAGLYPSSHSGTSGEAEIRGAGVDNPPGVRWKIEHGYKRIGG